MIIGFSGLNGGGVAGSSGVSGFSGIGESSGPIIPANALVYYALRQPNYVDAITEQVGKVNLLTAARASNQNVLQDDGVIETFLPNTVPLIAGRGVLIEDRATNKIATYNAAPTSLAGVSKYDPSGTGTLSLVSDTSELQAAGMSELISSGSMNGNVYKLVAGTGRIAIEIAASGVATASATLRVFAKGKGSLHLIGQYGSSKTDFDHPTYETATHVGSASFAAAELSVSAEAGDTVYVILPGFYQDSYVGSLVITAGAPAARAVSDITSSNFTENSFLIDSPNDDDAVNPCISGDLTNGDGESTFLNGVRETPLTLAFDGTVSGKYDGLLQATIVGANLVTSSGITFGVTVKNTASRISLELISGDLDTGIQDLRDNPFTLDYRGSGYLTGNLVADTESVRDFRIAAGDSATWLDSLPIPALIPANDFEIEFSYRFETNDDLQVMLSNLYDGNAANLYEVRREYETFSLLRRNSTNTGSSAFVLPELGLEDVSGRTFKFTLTQSSTVPTTLHVQEIGGSYDEIGTSTSDESFTNDVPWNQSTSWGSRNGTQFFANGVLENEILVEYL